MRLLEYLLEQPLAVALGWALLHFIWQGALLALLLAGVLRIARDLSANARYAAACVALSLMFVAPLGTMMIVIPNKAARALPPVFIEQPESQSPADLNKPVMRRIQTDDLAVSPHSRAPIQPLSLERLLPWLILLWLLGVVCLSLRLGGGWLYTRRLRRQGARLLEEHWRQTLRRLCNQMRVLRPVQLLESVLVKVPTAIGWLRPVILLPVGALTGLTPQQFEAIIAHELAHIRRHDYLINLLQALVETLLFYHPAVWWVSRRIRQEREHCCDDLAVAVCGDALTYARALLAMEQLRAAGPQLAVAANGGSLMKRIERLVGMQTQPKNRLAGLFACLIALTTVVSVGVGAQILLPSSTANGEDAVRRISKLELGLVLRGSNLAAQADATQAIRSAQNDQAAEALRPALQDSSWEARKAAVESLGRLNGSRATELLVAALRDAHPQVREQAVIGLGKRSDDAVVEALIAALSDSDWTVREQAAIALGRTKDGRAVETLLNALQDSEWQVREQAARSLGANGAERAVEPLIGALKDQHGQVREAAAKSLGWIGDRRAQNPLAQALQDADEQVRKKAAEALGLLEQSRDESSTDLLTSPLTQLSAGALTGSLTQRPDGFLTASLKHRVAEMQTGPLTQQSSGLLTDPLTQQSVALVYNTLSQPADVKHLYDRIPPHQDLPAQEHITQRYALSPNARVEVSYILGSVEIEAADDNNAEVYTLRSANTNADLDRFDRIHIEHTPSRLVLRGEDSKSDGIEIRHHVRLRLPRNCQLHLREINGRVSINGMEGAIRLNEVNGGAQIPQLSGELEMDGVNGSIRLGLMRLAPSGIRLRDVGSVELQVEEDVNAELEIGELDAAPMIETPRANLNRAGEKNFRGRIGAGGPVIRIIDVNGRVRIRNPL
jgi:beta-lactamase regulating signal transducer with metallopeptidase domain